MTIIIQNQLFKKISSIAGKNYLAVAFFLFCTALQTTTVAQTVHGTVTSETGTAIQAASVTVNKTSRGTITDKDGRFTISASSGDILTVSSLGFTSKEVTLHGESDIAISLIATNSQLNEVVVVGYGTQKRTDVTGAISTVSSKVINEIPVLGID